MKRSTTLGKNVQPVGYGGHVRAVQGFRYYGQAGVDARKGAA